MAEPGIRVKELEIGDNKFYIRRFPPFTGLEILGDLQKQFAEPFISITNGKQGESEEANQAAMMQAFGKLSAKMDGKTLRKLAEMLIDKNYISVSIDGAEPRKLDEAAMGLSVNNVGDVIAICWEVVSFNYSEVLARIASPTGPARFLAGIKSGNSTNP